MEHSENTRVKIPALVHLTRLGYKYLSLKETKQYINKNTNIFRNIFCESINQINNKSFSIEETDKIIAELEIQLGNDDLGKTFYNTLINGFNGIKLINFEDIDNNNFNVVTELTYKNGEDEFRPDIIPLINGIPLSFIEVKKPNNREGILAERNRINERFSNPKFKKFVNLTQLLVFSNNNEYDERSIVPIQGAFYGTSSYSNIFFNYFREEDASIRNNVKPINENEEENINDNNNDNHSQRSAAFNNDENEEEGEGVPDNQSQHSTLQNNDENEGKSEGVPDNQSQHSALKDNDENDECKSEKSTAHIVKPVEEDPNHPLMPVQLTAIIDNGTKLINDQASESENYVEEEEIKDSHVIDEQENQKNPNDVKYWTAEAMQLRPLNGCNPKILDKVIEGIRKERDNFIDLGLYQDSVEANEALNKATEYKDSVNKKIIQKKKQEELQKRLSDAKNYYSNLKSLVTKIEPNMAASFEKEMNNLIKRQNHELNQLTVEWESPQKQRLYNRSSANLRNLRTQSILLFNSHRFDEMELASRTADAMEMDESIKNQRKLENDFQEALNKMLDRHQKEREQLTIAHKVQKEKYEGAKNHDFLIAQRRIDKLEREIEDSKDPEKVWIHYSRAEAKGPPGPRPKPRQGRKNCLQAINTRDFNTLNLPPLLDSPKWKLDSPRSARERQERAKEIAALSRTGGSAGLAAIAGRRHTGVRASYGSTTKKRKS